MACLCPDWLCDAWEELAKRSPVPATQIAEILGISETELRCYGYKRENKNEHHRCAPQSRLVAATIASKNLVLLEAMAHQAGVKVEPCDPVEATSENVLRHAINAIDAIIQQVPVQCRNTHRDNIRPLLRRPPA